MRALLLAVLLAGCATGQPSLESIQAEVALVTADVRDAVAIIEDPELQDDLGRLVEGLDEVTALLAQAEATEATDVAALLLEMSDALMASDALTPETKLALFAVRAALRRLVLR